jgi:hypothetical protein
MLENVFLLAFVVVSSVTVSIGKHVHVEAVNSTWSRRATSCSVFGCSILC